MNQAIKEKKIYLAIDLGAGSGRVLAGEFDGARIEVHELNRFANTPVDLPDGWHWDITGLYSNILAGLQLAGERYGNCAVSLGVDTLGVDYGLLDGQGRLLGLPYQYRDTRTEGMMEATFAKASKKEIYDATGIQFMFFNSIFQLQAELKAKTPALEKAQDLLFLPDLLNYWLTGIKSQERSIASTSQLYNPLKADWDFGLIDKLGLPTRLFKKISEPGSVLGPLRKNVADALGLSTLKVTTVVGHDTGSAVAAVPSQARQPVFLSSGTWSLMGVELDHPVISEASYEDGFSNEIGVGGSVRFLKNICGLWLIQESRRYWLAQGQDFAYSEMARLASEAPAFRSLINPDHPRFAKAEAMPEKIQEFCRETNQPVPITPGAVVRCIYESLALRYSQCWTKLVPYLDKSPDVLHIIGGGCQDAMLNQFTSCALGVTVHAGPVEATGLGNILTQMMADGTLDSLADGRRLVAESFPPQIFNPKDTTAWQTAAKDFEKRTQLNP